MDSFKEKLRSNVIFVYTPMKVGSTTLVNSLRISLSDEYSVLHIHDENCLRVLTGIEMKVIDLIKYLSKDKKVYVMDVYRTPIERKMSCYFEWITYHWNRTEEEIKNIGIEKLIKRFNNLLPHLGNEDYLKEKYELSSSEIPLMFPHEKKYLHIKKDNIEYIKLRLKDSKEWGTILSEIFGKKIIISKTEEVRAVYEEFKKKYKIPLNHYEDLLKDESLKYYYTSEDQEEYIKGWYEVIENEKVSFYSKEEKDLYNKICEENWKGKSIKKDHYIDEGCTCKLCSIKRKRILNGKCSNEKIIHEEVVKKWIEDMCHLKSVLHTRKVKIGMKI